MSSDNTYSIPVFPLPMVVAPGESVALHIFEERYKEMISWCRTAPSCGEDGRFAITLSSDKEPASIATIMRIETILNERQDGELDLLAHGEERCRILRFTDKASYPMALAEPVVDVQSDWSETLANQAFTLHRKLLKMVAGEAPDEDFYSGHQSLSFRIAPTAGMENEKKQRLLELTDENERLRRLCDHLACQVVRVTDAVTAIHAIQTAWQMYSLPKQG